MPKAQRDETLFAFQMNNENILQIHGYPFHQVAGEWPAYVSGNWMNKIHIRDKIHDSTKMTGTAYFILYNPVATVDKVKDEDMCII